MRSLAYIITLLLLLTSACNNSKSIKQEAQFRSPIRVDYRAEFLDSAIMTSPPLLMEEPVDTVFVWEGDSLTSVFLISNTVMKKIDLVSRLPEYYESKTYGDLYYVDERNSIKVFEQLCRSVFSEERAKELYNCEIDCPQYYSAYDNKYYGMGRLKALDCCDTGKGFPLTVNEYRTLEKLIAANKDELFKFYPGESIVEGQSYIPFSIKFRNLYK